MPIPLTLVWFGALGPQDRAPNLEIELNLIFTFKNQII